MSNLSGKVLGNRYILLEKIGDGGTSLVYKARCQLLNRYVAIKILRPEYIIDDEFIKKFKRESLAAASLSHPNIVGIYDVGEEENIYYIVMEYINGKTLKEYIKEKGKIEYKEALNITYQIATALEHAHKNGVVHRDIKPHNILITEEKIVKVADFGIARASTSATVTNTGRVMGSVHYFSPEQAKGSFSDHRTDIYSLGVVLYEMLTGRLPYDADSPISIALKHIQDTFTEPSQLDDEIPQAVNDIVVKAMEKDMTKRYQNARELINDILLAQNNPSVMLRHHDEQEDYTKVIPVDEIEKELGKKQKDGSRKNRKRFIIAVISLLLLIGLGGLFVHYYNIYFNVQDVKVPVITGLSQDEAKQRLANSNLVMVVAGSQSSDKPQGTVLSVTPGEGFDVKANSEVKVILSSGPQQVSVPDLTNTDQFDAETKLSNMGLQVGNVDEQNSGTVSNGNVISQDPPANTPVGLGTKVNIVISIGPKINYVKVPLLVGKTLDEAETALANNNLSVGATEYDFDSKYIDGTVIAQSVDPGQQVAEGTKIDITVNKTTDGGNQGGQNGGSTPSSPSGQTNPGGSTNPSGTTASSGD